MVGDPSDGQVLMSVIDLAPDQGKKQSKADFFGDMLERVSAEGAEVFIGQVDHEKTGSFGDIGKAIQPVKAKRTDDSPDTVMHDLKSRQ